MKKFLLVVFNETGIKEDLLPKCSLNGNASFVSYQLSKNIFKILFIFTEINTSSA